MTGRIVYIKINSVRCRYNAVHFLQRSNNKYPIASPWRQDIFRMSFVLIKSYRYCTSMQCCMHHILLDRVITVPDCISLDKTSLPWCIRRQCWSSVTFICVSVFKLSHFIIKLHISPSSGCNTYNADVQPLVGNYCLGLFRIWIIFYAFIPSDMLCMNCVALDSLP